MKKKIILLPLLLTALVACGSSNKGNSQVPEDNEPKLDYDHSFVGEVDERTAYIRDYGAPTQDQLADEGFVLLKNDGFLPIANASEKKVSLAGKSSVQLAGGGAGSGSGSTSSGVTGYDMQKSLTEVGFKVNETLISFYKNEDKSGIGRTNGNDGWKGNSQVQIGETPLSCYTNDIIATLDEYKDAAIQVITREGSEGCDVRTCDARDFIANPGQKPGSNGNATNKSFTPTSPFSTKHALELSDNEAALLGELEKHTDHVIIVINSSNIFECEVLEKDPKVSAILWIGNPGDRGARAVGRILTGAVNPSGRTVDTWTRDFTKDPTFQNFSDNAQTNLVGTGSNQKYAAQDTMFNPDGTPLKSLGTYKNNNGVPKYADSANKVVEGGINGVKPSAYVSYEEGIYLDYRYYETRYADMAATDKAAADTWYNGEEGVLYPFGYGLSYTTFEQEIVGIKPAEDSVLDEKSDLISVTVKVKNVGNVAGKDAVQLYWKAPYTSGEIEKADHVLCAFDKSDLLEPGKEQLVYLTFHLQDVANYDFSDANNNDFAGYELDGGDYAVLLGKNAHEIYDEKAFKVIDDGIKYQYDRFTGNKVENRFTDRKYYNSLPGENDVGFDQFSRANFAGTFPSHPTMADRTVKQGSDAQEYLVHHYSIAEFEVEGNYDFTPEAALRTEDDAIAGNWAQAKETIKKDDGRMQLADMRGLDLDDPKWEEFMNQFTYDEMMNYIENNRMSNPGNSNIGKSGFSEGDGPQKFNIMWWVSSPIIAATFSPKLAHKQGECVGMESHISGKAGWWGPGVNTHRSPFGGRNFEYYAADPFLMGRMAAEVVGTATDRGVYAYFKHFTVNDQEKNRESGISYLTEQAFREIYLKSFQMVFEEGKSIGVMASYNRIGLMETAASYPLLTEVLRGEWGFKGAVLSDMTHSGNGSIDNLCYENVCSRALAGNNLQLDSGGFSDQVENLNGISWSDDAFNGKGAPVFEYEGEEVISFSWWYACRKLVKEVMYMSINCTGMFRGLTLVVDDNGMTYSEGDEFNEVPVLPEEYNVEVGSTIYAEKEGEKDKDVIKVEYKVNNRVDLPRGIWFEDGKFSGQFYEAGYYYIDIIAIITLQEEDEESETGYKVTEQRYAIKYEILVLPNDDFVIPEEKKNDKPKEEAKESNGCAGDLASAGLLISLIAFAGIGFALVSFRKREQN